MSVKQVSVFVENKPGALYELTEVFAKHQIDMRALSVAESSDFGILRMIVNKPDQAAVVLKEAGYVHNITSVLAVAIPDEPGGLNRVLLILAEAKINLEYMYAFLGGAGGCAYMIFRVEENQTAGALAALAARGVRLAEQEELDRL